MFPSNLQRRYASCLGQMNFLYFDFDLKKNFSFQFDMPRLWTIERATSMSAARSNRCNQSEETSTDLSSCHHHRFDQFTGSVFPSRVNSTQYCSRQIETDAYRILHSMKTGKPSFNIDARRGQSAVLFFCLPR
jgi:hypothetical protein